jgi:hypothetical protein
MADQPSLSQVIKAVFASAIGVQSKANLQKNSTASSFIPYLIVGVIGVVLFILILLLWVQSMLS